MDGCTLSGDVEMRLTIHREGIAKSFLDWFERQYDAASECQRMLDDESSGCFRQCDNYWVNGLWIVGVPRQVMLREEPGSILFIQVCPNIPMQYFADEFWKFVSAIGINDFTLQYPPYWDRVEAAMRSIKEKASKQEAYP